VDTPVLEVDAAVVGAGPAGLGAATRLMQRRVGRVVVLDREDQPGGLPAQSGHRGFGLLRYKFPLTGGEYAGRLARAATAASVEVRLGTTVLSVSPSLEVVAVSPAGLVRYKARAVILATGCREMPRALRAAGGDRPSGIFNTAVVHRLLGTLQELPGRRAVIVGSEDVGLMAVRLFRHAGARVLAVVEELPYLLGYRANYLYSVAPFRVPVLLGHRVVRVVGRRRVEGIEVAPPGGAPVRRIPCDTVVFSGRFVPESALARDAGIALDVRTQGPLVDQHYHTVLPGIFACGNLLHGAESSDVALEEGERAGEAAAAHLAGQLAAGPAVAIHPGAHLASVVPQRVTLDDRGPVHLLVRPDVPLVRATVLATRDAHQVGRTRRLSVVPHRAAKLTVSLQGVDGTSRLEVGFAGRVRSFREAAASWGRLAP